MSGISFALFLFVWFFVFFFFALLDLRERVDLWPLEHSDNYNFKKPLYPSWISEEAVD